VENALTFQTCWLLGILALWQRIVGQVSVAQMASVLGKHLVVFVPPVMIATMACTVPKPTQLVSLC